MILYQLNCEDEHTFEVWFRDSGAFDEQAQQGHVECPYCGSTKVAKAPMAPNIASGASQPQGEANLEGPAASAGNGADAHSHKQDHEQSHERAHEVAQKILDAVGKIRDYATENFEDVGDEFADEARKIHDGETEERGIYGQATEDEARELEEEGVEFVRLPGTPRRDG